MSRKPQNLVELFGDFLRNLGKNEHEYLPNSCNKTLNLTGPLRISHTVVPNNTVTTKKITMSC